MRVWAVVIHPERGQHGTRCVPGPGVCRITTIGVRSRAVKCTEPIQRGVNTPARRAARMAELESR